MKRMLDQKTIDELQALLSKIGVENGVLFADTLAISNLVCLNGLDSLVDDEENVLFPLENNAGKVFAVNEDESGVEAVDRLIAESLPNDLWTLLDNACADDFNVGVALTNEQKENFVNFFKRINILNDRGSMLFKTYEYNDDVDNSYFYCFGHSGVNVGEYIEVNVDQNTLFASRIEH